MDVIFREIIERLNHDTLLCTTVCTFLHNCFKLLIYYYITIDDDHTIKSPQKLPKHMSPSSSSQSQQASLHVLSPPTSTTPSLSSSSQPLAHAAVGGAARRRGGCRHGSAPRQCLGSGGVTARIQVKVRISMNADYDGDQQISLSDH